MSLWTTLDTKGQRRAEVGYPSKMALLNHDNRTPKVVLADARRTVSVTELTGITPGYLSLSLSLSITYMCQRLRTRGRERPYVYREHP